MTRPDWMAAFFTQLADAGIVLTEQTVSSLAPAHGIQVRAESWGRLAQEAKLSGCRWAAAH